MNMELSLTKVIDKKEISRDLKKYIAHKRQLAVVCAYYKQSPRAESLSKVWDLYKMVQNDCEFFPLVKLLEMVRINELHLRNILPVMENTSYKGELEKLERILTIAKAA